LDENPNFRTPGTLLVPLAMGRLAGEQEPDEKNCPVHAPSIHGAFMEADSLWPAGRDCFWFLHSWCLGPGSWALGNAHCLGSWALGTWP